MNLIIQVLSSENGTDKMPCVFCRLLNHKSIKCLKSVTQLHAKKYVRKVDYVLFVLIKIIMHLHVRGTISVNTVVVNAILQFALLIKISYLDLTTSLQPNQHFIANSPGNRNRFT